MVDPVAQRVESAGITAPHRTEAAPSPPSPAAGPQSQMPGQHAHSGVFGEPAAHGADVLAHPALHHTRTRSASSLSSASSASSLRSSLSSPSGARPRGRSVSFYPQVLVAATWAPEDYCRQPLETSPLSREDVIEVIQLRREYRRETARLEMLERMRQTCEANGWGWDPRWGPDRQHWEALEAREHEREKLLRQQWLAQQTQPVGGFMVGPDAVQAAQPSHWNY